MRTPLTAVTRYRRLPVFLCALRHCDTEAGRSLMLLMRWEWCKPRRTQYTACSLVWHLYTRQHPCIPRLHNDGLLESVRQILSSSWISVGIMRRSLSLISPTHEHLGSQRASTSLNVDTGHWGSLIGCLSSMTIVYDYLNRRIFHYHRYHGWSRCLKFQSRD